jgi:hypothetical protein
MIQIEKNIPIPNQGKGKRSVKYPFMQMEKGDSFFIECEYNKKNDNKLASSVYAMSKKLGVQFTKQKVEGGYRIWRIS